MLFALNQERRMNIAPGTMPRFNRAAENPAALRHCAEAQATGSSHTIAGAAT
jgi:hypothetical protein